MLRYDASPMASSVLRKYLKETRQPIYSAALVAPFFLIYHAGTVLFRTTYVNGADALIVRILGALSVHSMFASALVLLGCFVIWQVRSRSSWQIHSIKLLFLFLESLLLAVLLFFAFGWLSFHLGLATPAPAGTGAIERLVLYCGAGIYEELLFRGFLLGAMLFLLRKTLRRRALAAGIATVSASLLFALFHYLGPAGDPFSIHSFLQRTLGGMYFSMLFVTRGFGVTAASHALYDILVGLSLA